MNKHTLLLLFVFLWHATNAQIGIGTNVPDNSSAIDIRLKKGVLLSRVALTGTTDVTTIPLPVNSLLIYNTATISDVTSGYYYWSAKDSKWIQLLDGLSSEAPWSLKGNNNIDSNIHFIGTTENQDVVFKRSNIMAGRLAYNMTSFGRGSLMYLGGDYNTAIGSNALQVNKGQFNTAIGYEALKNSTGDTNTALGGWALTKLVQGSSNLGIGAFALKDLKEGRHNVAVGQSALGYSTISNYNIAIGSGAGANTSYAGAGLDGFNIIIGSNDDLANQGLRRGKNNTIIGSRIRSTSMPDPMSNNIIIADGSGNRRINVNESGNVGLGIDTAHESAALHIENTSKGVLLPQIALTGTADVATVPSTANSLLIYNTATASDITPGYYYWNKKASKWIRIMDEVSSMNSWALAGNQTIAIGYKAGEDLLADQDGVNVMIGFETAKGLVTGIKNTIIGSNIIDLPADLSNAIIIGEGATASLSNTIRLGNTSITNFTGQVAYSYTSDKRYKTNIQTLPLGLDFVNKLRPVEYVRKNNEAKTKEWGVIAQELHETLEEVHYKNAGIVQEDGSANKMLSVRYTDLIAPIIKSVQELTEQNKKLEEEGKLLLEKINQLEIKIEKIK